MARTRQGCDEGNTFPQLLHLRKTDWDLGGSAADNFCLGMRRMCRLVGQHDPPTSAC